MKFMIDIIDYKKRLKLVANAVKTAYIKTFKSIQI